MNKGYKGYVNSRWMRFFESLEVKIFDLDIVHLYGTYLLPKYASRKRKLKILIMFFNLLETIRCTYML